MDSLRKEIEEELKRTRIDKSRIYDAITRLIDQVELGGSSSGPVGPTGPQGPQGPPGPQGSRGAMGPACVTETPVETKAAAPKKVVVPKKKTLPGV